MTRVDLRPRLVIIFLLVLSFLLFGVKVVQECCLVYVLCKSILLHNIEQQKNKNESRSNLHASRFFLNLASSEGAKYYCASVVQPLYRVCQKSKFVVSFLIHVTDKRKKRMAAHTLNRLKNEWPHTH